MDIFSNDNKDFGAFTKQVEAVVDSVSEHAKEADIAGLNKLITNFKIKTEDFYRENRKLNIGVVGQVKAGKSSFLNTLLFGGGRDIAKGINA